MIVLPPVLLGAPVLALLAAISWMMAAAVGGGVFVALRRWLVTDRFPFFTGRYLPLTGIPFAVMVAAGVASGSQGNVDMAMVVGPAVAVLMLLTVMLTGFLWREADRLIADRAAVRRFIGVVPNSVRFVIMWVLAICAGFVALIPALPAFLLAQVVAGVSIYPRSGGVDEWLGDILLLLVLCGLIGVAFGWLFVLLRGWIASASWPYVMPGYLLVALVPLVPLLGLVGRLPQAFAWQYLLCGMVFAQVGLAAMTAIFVSLTHLLGWFDGATRTEAMSLAAFWRLMWDDASKRFRQASRL